MSQSITELASQCIRCGFCLEDCPTFQETGSELESPRGRIYLIRSAEEGKLAWSDVQPHLDLCLGCRACETACPSGVQYGAIFEQAKANIGGNNLIRKGLLTVTTNPPLLRAQLRAAEMIGMRRAPMKGQEANLPTLPFASEALPLPFASERKGSVVMLEGCAMRVLYPEVHAATERLLARLGYETVKVTQGCCGALHAHNGDLKTARKMARQLIKDLPKDTPIIVNSAGCGSTMKEYSDLLGTDETPFVERVFDLSEFLFERGLIDLLQKSPGLPGTVITYHDACHLAHGQRIASVPRTLLASIPGATLIELPEANTCCGSAGIYNVLQPEMARKLLDRKVDNINKTGATIVATGNPGCHGWIAQGCDEQRSARVMHTAEVLDAAFGSGNKP